MDIFTILLGFDAGIVLLGRILQWKGLSRKSVKVAFVTIAMGFLFFWIRSLSFLTIQAASPNESYNQIYEYQTATSILLSIIYLAWVVCYLAGGRLSRYILGIGLWLVVITIVVLILPPGIKTDIVSRLNQINIIAKVQYVDHQIILKPWKVLGDLLFFSVFGYSFYASYRRYHREKRAVDLLLTMAMVLSILALVINLYADSDLVGSELKIPYTSITIIGFIAIAFVTEIIQTRKELHHYKEQLELLAGLRVADLGQASTRLKKRVNDREKVAASLRQRDSRARALLDTSPEMAVLLDSDGLILDIHRNGAKRLGLDTAQAKRDHHRHITDLDIINHVFDLTTEIQDLNRVLPSISEIITKRLNARSTYVLVASDGTEGAAALHGFTRGKGPIKPVLINDLYYRNPTLVRENFLNRKSIVVTDIASPAIPPYIQHFMVTEEIQNTMLLPLWIHHEMKGLVSVCRGSPFDQFSSEDTKFAEAVVTHIARALENVFIVKAVKEKAVREERDRLAREMHDSVTQTIYSASLITEVLPNIWERNPEEGKRDLIKVRQLVNGALAEMRTILFELRPSALEMASLETLLRQLGVAISGRERIHVQMSTEGDYSLPPNVKTTIYRIAQEVFNNIAKHSEATQVQTILKLKSDRLALHIADNGKGFLPSQASSKGMGLRIMQERAALIGARIDIDSEPMQGTIVKVTWNKNHMEKQ